MKTLEVINTALCIVSFVFYFIALCLDFFDRKNGSTIRRVVFFLCLLYNSSMIMKAARHEMDNIVFIWLIVSAFMFISKVLQYRGKTKAMDNKINNITQSITKGNKTPAHN